MPHLVLHHCANAGLEPQGLQVLHDLVEALGRVQTFPIESLKCRLQRADVVLVAGGHQQSFVHAELALLEGRDISVRQQIAQAIADVLVRHAPASDCQLSVEVREMDRSSYVKRGAGTSDPAALQ